MKKFWFAVGLNDLDRVHQPSISGAKTDKEQAVAHAKKHLQYHSDNRVTRFVICEATDVVEITEPVFDVKPILSVEDAVSKMETSLDDIRKLAVKEPTCEGPVSDLHPSSDITEEVNLNLFRRAV